MSNERPPLSLEQLLNAQIAATRGSAAVVRVLRQALADQKRLAELEAHVESMKRLNDILELNIEEPALPETPQAIEPEESSTGINFGQPINLNGGSQYLFFLVPPPPPPPEPQS